MIILQIKYSMILKVNSSNQIINHICSDGSSNLYLLCFEYQIPKRKRKTIQYQTRQHMIMNKLTRGLVIYSANSRKQGKITISFN